MDNIWSTALDLLSVVLIAGILAAWLALIVRRYRVVGQMIPLQDRAWFIGVFREGLGLMKRSRWILLILFLAVCMSAGESWLVNLIGLKKHPDLLEQVSRQRSPGFDHYSFQSFLLYLRLTVFPTIFGALGQVNSAMLKSLHSFSVASGFLLFLMIYLPASRSTGGDTPAGGFSVRVR